MKRLLGIVATIVMALAFARLVDAVGKRELVRTVAELSGELAAVERQHQELSKEAERLEADHQLLEHRLRIISRREPYLVIQRGLGRVRLELQDKVLLEVPLRVRGPLADVDAFWEMSKRTYQVLAKRSETVWFRPDWLYRLEGVEPPLDSASRVVSNAFGPGILFLGGGLAIHGRVSEDVPVEALDHTYIELDSAALRSVLSMLQPGSLVFIQ
ncbi:MAG: DUF948 domain-containing protein [candidate division WOR-3 bacterium]